MQIDTVTLIAIVGMALATYATRAGGLWLIARVPLSRRAAAGLRQLPGALLAAIIMPAVLAQGPAGIVGALVTFWTARRTPNLLPPMAAGVAAVALLRAIGW
jgi:uncharacterized membrane protein